MTTIAATGCFDVLHVGHVRLLEWAKAAGDRLIVGINSDASIRQLKGPLRPINCELDRVRMLQALRCVDKVIVFKEQDAANFLLEYKPDIWVKGSDYNLDKLSAAEKAAVLSYCGRIHFCPQMSDTRSSGLIASMSVVLDT